METKNVVQLDGRLQFKTTPVVGGSIGGNTLMGVESFVLHVFSPKLSWPYNGTLGHQVYDMNLWTAIRTMNALIRAVVAVRGRPERGTRNCTCWNQPGCSS